MRSGLWVSGAGGSGVLVGRQADGSWSAPSGILLHTAGVGFLVGVDIYDCVVVINTAQALDAFTKIRCTLGGEVSAVAGPVGLGGILESEVHKRHAPIFTYLKSRGFCAGVQVDGTVIIERTDENERFYGERISVANILAGKVRHPPRDIGILLDTIKSAQGDKVDVSLLPREPPPGDFEVDDEQEPGTFGIPDTQDPDPFGVAALEQQGLEIREAGTRKRPTSEQFEFRPSPTSPIFGAFRRSLERHSMDNHTMSRRPSWRAGTVSGALDRGTQTVDMGTQTDVDLPAGPAIRSDHVDARASPKMTDIPEHTSTNGLSDSTRKRHSSATGHDEANDSEGEEAVIQEIKQAAAPHFVSQARLVTVAKPSPPRLPPRNPIRGRLNINSELANTSSTRDQAAGPSPFTPASPRSSLSVRGDASSATSQLSLSSGDDLEHVSEQFRPKLEPVVSQGNGEVSEEFHMAPEKAANEA